MELETAVRLEANLVHMVWGDGTYAMVAVQESLKYGRTSGIDFVHRRSPRGYPSGNAPRCNLGGLIS